MSLFLSPKVRRKKKKRKRGKTVEDLDYYNIGSETIAGCKCWVFDAMGLNAIEGKFRVNMENGICMKYLDPDGEGFEFTQLNLNYNG